MFATEAGSLLVRLSQGGEVSLHASEVLTLDALEQQGYVERTADTSHAESQLARLRAELIGPVARAASPAREGQLRTEILALSEAVVRARGVAHVVRSEGGAYRGASTRVGYVVTFAGRTLLGDLGPRLARVATLEVTQFQQHMSALRGSFAFKAKRAAELHQAIQAASTRGVHASALRSVALGLSARREAVPTLAGAWRSTFEALQASRNAQSPIVWNVDQEASAAEAIQLSRSTLLDASQVAPAFHALRVRAHRDFCAGNAEDALDAAVHLVHQNPDHAIQEASAFAVELGTLGVPMTLSVALALRAAGQLQQGPTFAHFYRNLAQANEGVDDRERHAAALALTLSRGAAESTLARALELRAYLSRFAATGMLTPACLLAVLPVEPAEALDLLRLASAELQKARFESGGPESLTLAVKFLLQMVILAAGQEGDAEEQLGLIRFDGLALEALGHAGLVSHIPLSLTTLTAFHRPALDAAIVYQRQYQPMHSSSIFGSGHRSGGWG